MFLTRDTDKVCWATADSTSESVSCSDFGCISQQVIFQSSCTRCNSICIRRMRCVRLLLRVGEQDRIVHRDVIADGCCVCKLTAFTNCYLESSSCSAGTHAA